MEMKVMQSKISDLIRGASFSDLHMLHRRTPTTLIISNLNQSLPDNAETAALDIIFFAGDVFDNLGDLANEDVWEVHMWAARVLRICKKYNIILRILEGTPSHDWKQSHLFVVLNELAEIGADIKHVKELSIEYIEPLRISVLYVPDEWGPTDKTLSQVKELLKAKGLDKVDLAIMHGQFPHQLPSHVAAPVHDPEAYLAFVRFFIFIGHVHTRSVYDRIQAQGSHDRNGHGEEEAKGHLRFQIDLLSGEHAATFIENVTAQRYVTVSCRGMTLDETLSEIHDQVKDLPELSFVRVEADKDNPILASMEVLIRKWPLFTWSKIARKDKEEKEEVEDVDQTYTPLTITKENVDGLLMDRLVNVGLQGDQLSIANRILKELL